MNSTGTLYCVPTGTEWAYVYGMAIAWIVVVSINSCSSCCLAFNRQDIHSKLDTIYAEVRTINAYKPGVVAPYNV
jgi:hypothetical protein